MTDRQWIAALPDMTDEELAEAGDWVSSCLDGYYIDVAGEWITEVQRRLREHRHLVEQNTNLREACGLAMAFGSQGDTHEGLSVSEFLRAAYHGERLPTASIFEEER